MLKDWCKKYGIVILIMVMSACFGRFWQMPWWLNLSMILLWLVTVKVKPKYAWIFLVLLVVLNLNLNRLFYFKINPLLVSFDKEQSFLDYPGIRESIIRYKQEGLWLPYRLRGCFYSSYLIIFSYLTGVVKLLSPLFWIGIIGFSGFSLFLLGWIDYFKKGFRGWYIGFWFLVVILSSGWRVLGDSVTAIYLTIPVIIVLIKEGLKSNFFKKYQIFWWLLFLVDILLK